MCLSTRVRLAGLRRPRSHNRVPPKPWRMWLLIGAVPGRQPPRLQPDNAAAEMALPDLTHENSSECYSRAVCQVGSASCSKPPNPTDHLVSQSTGIYPSTLLTRLEDKQAHGSRRKSLALDDERGHKHEHGSDSLTGPDQSRPGGATRGGPTPTVLVSTLFLQISHIQDPGLGFARCARPDPAGLLKPAAAASSSLPLFPPLERRVCCT